MVSFYIKLNGAVTTSILRDVYLCILTNLFRIRSRMQTCFRHWLCSLQSSICRLAHRGSSLPDSRSSRSTGFRSESTGFRYGSTRSDFRLSSKRDLFSRLRRFERWDTQLNEQNCYIFYSFLYLSIFQSFKSPFQVCDKKKIFL
jgi:hypothetical protein